jgi:hypothetical protein
MSGLIEQALAMAPGGSTAPAETEPSTDTAARR